MANIFLNCGSIKGECTKDPYQEQVECMSWGWGATHSSSMGMVGAGGSEGTTTVQSINISKLMDKSSVNLFEYCCTAKHEDEWVLHITKTSDGKLVPWYIITMTEAFIESYQVSGGADQVPIESVTIGMAKAKVEYKIQDKTGAVKNGGDFTWNLHEHKKE